MYKSRVRENIIRHGYSEFSRKELQRTGDTRRAGTTLCSGLWILLLQAAPGTWRRWFCLEMSEESYKNSRKSRKIRLSIAWGKTILCSQKSAASLPVFSMDCSYLLCLRVTCFCIVNWEISLNWIAWFPILFSWGGREILSGWEHLLLFRFLNPLFLI